MVLRSVWASVRLRGKSISAPICTECLERENLQHASSTVTRAFHCADLITATLGQNSGCTGAACSRLAPDATDPGYGFRGGGHVLVCTDD